MFKLGESLDMLFLVYVVSMEHIFYVHEDCLLIARFARNPSLKRKSPKQTRTNSVFAKIRKDGFD